MEKLPFYIITSDSTSHILEATSYLYNKYWNVDGSQQFTVLGNNKPACTLPDNFEFVKIKNLQVKKGWVGNIYQKWYLKNWTRYIYKFIKDQSKSEYFVLTLDDYLPNDYLKREILQDLLSQARNNGHVGRIGLGWSPRSGYEELSRESGYSLIRLNQNANYRLVCQTSVWNREYLMKYFKHYWTPWDLELRGSWWAKNDGWDIIGAKNDQPFDWVEESALSGRWPGMMNVLGMRPEDVKYLVDRGILKPDRLQYGMWTEFQPPLFSSVGYGFNFDLIKDRVTPVVMDTVYSHYKHIYQPSVV